MIRGHSREYEEVLVSERWRAVRAETIRRAGYRCQARGCGGSLDVHHAYGYRNLGNERPDELQALCRSCHDHVHAQRQVVNAGCLAVGTQVLMGESGSVHDAVKHLVSRALDNWQRTWCPQCLKFPENRSLPLNVSPRARWI